MIMALVNLAALIVFWPLLFLTIPLWVIAHRMVPKDPNREPMIQISRAKKKEASD